MLCKKLDRKTRQRKFNITIDQQMCNILRIKMGTDVALKISLGMLVSAMCLSIFSVFALVPMVLSYSEIYWNRMETTYEQGRIYIINI